MHTRIKNFVTLAVPALLFTGAWLHAGPLVPPVGPIAPTPGPEPRIAVSAANTPGDADSLFRITQPGSYYLAGNIAGAAGRHGVEVAASGVTLDLNGFDLSGVPGSLDGVFVNVGSPANIVVMNGSVRAWGGDGVDLQTAGAINSRIERVRAGGNGGHGILVAASTAVDGCTAGGNTLSGINTQNGCVVSRCAARGNTTQGILVGNSSTVSECVAELNTGIGISTGGGVAIVGCTAQSNSSNGFSLGAGATATGCAARLNVGDGIFVDFGSAVIGCSVTSNGGHGIQAASNSLVSECTARANTNDGIRLVSGCIARGNACAVNGNGTADGAGIHVVGSDCLIEGNNCVTADRGIDVDAAGNTIIRNACAGNTTNWTIVANNVVGPILDRTAPASAAISGNSAPSSLGTTEPNANFTY